MNRYLAAKKLNHNDEVVWYHNHKNKLLKCIWRNGIEDISFVAIWMKQGTDENGYATMKENGVYKAFTLGITK